jgi:hypothetical protein
MITSLPDPKKDTVKIIKCENELLEGLIHTPMIHAYLLPTNPTDWEVSFRSIGRFYLCAGQKHPEMQFFIPFTASDLWEIEIFAFTFIAARIASDSIGHSDKHIDFPANVHFRKDFADAVTKLIISKYGETQYRYHV